MQEKCSRSSVKYTLPFPLSFSLIIPLSCFVVCYFQEYQSPSLVISLSLSLSSFHCLKCQNLSPLCVTIVAVCFSPFPSDFSRRSGFSDLERYVSLSRRPSRQINAPRLYLINI
eukprot:sb/3476826/